MKNFFIAALLLLCLSAMAQNQPTPNEQLRQVFDPVDKSVMSTGYLVNQQFSFAEPGHFQGLLSDTFRADINVFGALYGAMYNSKTNSGGGMDMPFPNYVDTVKNWQTGQAIQIALMSWQYERIVPDVAVEYNLLSFSGGQFFDVPGRPFSPFFLDTLFTAAPVCTSVKSLSPTFSLPAELWYNNLADTLPTISLDAGDGLGWRSLAPDSTVQALYSDAGDKTLTIRLVYTNRTVFAKMKLLVFNPPAEERGWSATPDESIEITASKSYLGEAGTGTMHVFYNCEGKKMLKPLIIVEGIEFYFPAAGTDVKSSYKDFFDRLKNEEVNGQPLNKIIEPEGYDIIYLDYSKQGGSDYIQRNAFLVEEVIKWVNAQKAAAGSTEQNVVIGISMGGLVAKYALLDMQNNGPAHDMRLYISFDAPLRGANIPIGSQCALSYFNTLLNISITVDPPGNNNSTTYSIPPVPQLDEAIAAIQAPATRQIVFYHANNISGTVEPINSDRETFFAELDAMGALSLRHVAITNGADDGTAIEFNTFAGTSFFTATGTYSPCFDLLDYPLPYFDPNTLQWTTIQQTLTVCPFEGSAFYDIKATGNNAQTNIFTGNLGIKFLDFIGPIEFNLSASCYTKPYDVAPGGSSVLGTAPLGLASTLIPAVPGLIISGGLSAAAPATNHHCFIPTFSALSAAEPIALIGMASTCGTAARCSTPDLTSPLTNPYSGMPEVNQDHVTIDDRIAGLLIDELITLVANPFPLPEAPATLTSYYNAGLSPQKTIPDLIIASSSGQLSINNSGKVGFATGNESLSPDNLYNAYTRCGSITVENGAKLVVGADAGLKHGVLTVTAGSTVHIKSGGTLYVTSEQSNLIIKNGATLILDAGANVRLESPGASITIYGYLVVNGDINFFGPGYFDFAEGNHLIYGPGYDNFKLVGMAKDKRFVRLSADVLIEEGHRLNWSNGLLEAANGAVYLQEAAGLDFNLMTLTGGQTQGVTAIEAHNSGAVNLNGCFVTNLDLAINGNQGVGCNILNCEFSKYAVGISWHDTWSVNVSGSIFTGLNKQAPIALKMTDVRFLLLNFSQFNDHIDPSLSGIANDGGLSNGIPAIDLDNMVACLVKGTSFSGNSIGIKGDDPNTSTTANIYAFQGSAFVKNTAGIYVVGDAIQGAVLADCVYFIENRNGIRGKDISLMIDSRNTRMFDFDTDSPNHFIKKQGAGPGSTENHVRICYNLKPVGASNLMRNNFWGLKAGGITIPDPAPVPLLRLLDADCAAQSAAPIILPVASGNSLCSYGVIEPTSSSFSSPYPGSECALSVGNNPGNNVPITVHEKFHLGTYLMQIDSVEQAISAFRPVASLWQPNMTGYANNCKQYIQVAKAFVDASDNNPFGLQRPGGERTQKPAARSLLIAPNPASNSALLQLSSGEHQIRVWDAFGNLYHQATASDTYLLETASWQSGIYFVETVAADGSRKTGKLVIQR